MERPSFLRLVIVVAVLCSAINLSLTYEGWKAAVSTTRATFAATVADCGPKALSGPKEIPGLRGLKRYRLVAKLSDGRDVSTERFSADPPPCATALTVQERVTPWGGVWYWTEQ